MNRYDTSSLHHGLRSKINLEFVGDIEFTSTIFPPINSSSYFSSRLSLLEIYVFRSIEKFLRIITIRDYPLRSPLFVVPVNWHPTSGRFVADRRATESTRERIVSLLRLDRVRIPSAVTRYPASIPFTPRRTYVPIAGLIRNSVEITLPCSYASSIPLKRIEKL